jgi:hypothetical protein
MQRTGTANLPLHTGKAPRWLFQRMVKLAGGISAVIVDEYGQEELLKRLSDPFWFQAFGCVLGFDWHSSGLTTTVTGALKEGIDREELGIAVCGGKGKTSMKAPNEIRTIADEFGLAEKERNRLVYSSRMSAKVDSAAVQDGYNLYHHSFIFNEKGKWVVVQQGLNNGNSYARRYHWSSEKVESFVNEPHTGICCDDKGEEVLNMTSRKSGEARKTSVDIVNERNSRRYFTGQTIMNDFLGTHRKLDMPRIHYIINMNKRNIETLRKAYDIQPGNYEELLAIKDIGPKSVRALALVSELVYGKPPNWQDPVKYSFSHGGKDGIPYPVDRETYDKSVDVLRTGLEQARLGNKDKLNAIRRLNRFVSY